MRMTPCKIEVPGEDEHEEEEEEEEYVPDIYYFT